MELVTPQTICGNSGSDWQVTFNAPAGGGPVLTYPDVQIDYTAQPTAVSSLNPAASASWAENMNAHAGTSAEAAFDIWLRRQRRPAGRERGHDLSRYGRQDADGSQRPDRRASDLPRPFLDYGRTRNNAGELIWYLPRNERSRSACTVQMLQWLQAHGYRNPSATLYQYEFGWEIYSTGGYNEMFQMNAYSVSGLPAGN